MVTALIGFHSASVRSQPGRLPVGMYAFDSSGSTKDAAPSCPAASSLRDSRPSRIPAQVQAKRKSSSSPTAPAAPAADPSIRQPTASPVSSSGTVPTVVTRRSATACPSGTAARLTGIVRNRSITPRWVSWAAWNMPVISPPAAVATSSPGTRKNRYSRPGTARALPNT